MSADRHLSQSQFRYDRLYRGTGNQAIPAVDEDIEFPTNSFTTDPSAAEHYADAGYGKSPAIWEVRGNITGYGVPSEARQSEVLAAGRARVREVSTLDLPHVEGEGTVPGHRVVADWLSDSPLGEHYSRR